MISQPTHMNIDPLIQMTNQNSEFFPGTSGPAHAAADVVKQRGRGRGRGPGVRVQRDVAGGEAAATAGRNS